MFKRFMQLVDQLTQSLECSICVGIVHEREAVPVKTNNLFIKVNAICFNFNSIRRLYELEIWFVVPLFCHRTLVSIRP